MRLHKVLAILLCMVCLGISLDAQAVPRSPFALNGDLVMEPSDFIEHPATRESYRAKLEELVEQASGHQARLIDFFAGPGGLTGVIIKGLKEDSKTLVGWVPPGADYLVLGRVFDRKGADQTVLATTNLLGGEARGAAALSLDDVYSMALQFRGVDVFPDMENPANTLCVFFDTGCHYCKRLYRYVRQNAHVFEDQKIQVKWMPVAFGAEKAERQATAILQFGMEQWGKAVSADWAPEKELTEAVRNNSQLAAAAVPKLFTPLLIWKGEDGVELDMGAPSSQSELATLVKKIAVITP